MKGLFKLALAFLPLAFFACGGETSTDTVSDGQNEMDQMSEMMQEMTGETPKGVHENFELYIPEPMMEMTELNPNAAAQYGYIEEVTDDSGHTHVMEHYLLVIEETKADIASYPVDLDWDAMSYRDNVIESLRSGENVSKFVVLTAEPKVEKLNGLDCVLNDMEATLESRVGPVKLFYKLAVFEGEKAFYQILTWCVNDQRNVFEYDMDQIIASFKEK